MNKLAREIHEISISKGFWDKERNMGELLMLCVSELSEALEADRKGRSTVNNAFEFIDKSANLEEFCSRFRGCIKDTFEDEIADTIIRLLDLCAAKNIDIETHIRLKIEYNKTRERLHGKKY